MSDQTMVINHIMSMPNEQTVIVLRDGTTLELSDNDIEMLEMHFASECENCGFDPNADPFEDSADSADEEDDDDEALDTDG